VRGAEKIMKEIASQHADARAAFVNQTKWQAMWVTHLEKSDTWEAKKVEGKKRKRLSEKLDSRIDITSSAKKAPLVQSETTIFYVDKLSSCDLQDDGVASGNSLNCHA